LNDSGPTVSVVIPCYNGGAFLRETLESVLAQTRPALEVIVVDDGSTDDSGALAESFGPPVRVIRQPNQGESVARNRAIAEATGEWVAFCDADDTWLPAKLAEQAKLMAAGVRAICSGNTARFPGGFEPISIPRAEMFSRPVVMEHGAPCHISTLVVRRDLPVTFPTWTKWSEDILYYLDLLGHTPVRIVAQPLVVYRKHAGGQTARPDIRDRQDASLRRWLEINEGRIPATEFAALTAAFRRREKHTSLTRALKFRRDRQPGAAVGLYSRILFRSLYTPSSRQILSFGARGFLGGMAEVLRIRRHPA